MQESVSCKANMDFSLSPKERGRDVYKRQQQKEEKLQGEVQRMPGEERHLPEGCVSGNILEITEEQADYLRKKLWTPVNTGAVSYTHLDVYKRQNLPQNQIFTWNDVSRFRKGQYILMHSVIYRTKLLRECGLELPKHTFYVDNIYVYKPLPSVKTLYYICLLYTS